MKKILSFLMAALLLVGVCTAAIAENDDGVITIQNATAGKTYAIYKVFDATYSGNNISYTYTKTGDPDLFYNALTGSDSPFTLTATGVNMLYYVTIKTGSTASAISNWLKAHENLLTQYGDAITATSSTVTFTDLPYGYYYVTSTLGTAVTLDTVTPNVTIIDKNQKPGFTHDDNDVLTGKMVMDANGDWVHANSLNVGDTAKFQINAILTNYVGMGMVREYVFSDTMDDGFGIPNNFVVSIKEQDSGSEDFVVLNDGDYTVERNGNDFTVKIPWATYDEDNSVWTSIYDASCEIRIEYSATVLDTAKLGSEGNKNKVNLSWNFIDHDDTNPNPDGTDKETPETITYVYEIVITKVDANNKSLKLSGAEFVLRKGNAAEGYEYLKYTPATEDTPAKVEWVDDIAEATVYTTDDNGSAIISGIAEGTYELVETKAPEGYNLLSGPVTVIVPTPAEEGQEQNHENVTVTVENSTGSELPSTGGIGTTIFYIVGGVLMVAAVVLFATKKRMSASKN